ncbi:MAG: hypothetical protein WAV76_10630 [Bacteroidota bacterium]
MTNTKLFKNKRIRSIWNEQQNPRLRRASDIILYTTDDGKNRIEVRLDEETVWLTQMQMAELFQTTKQNISLHIKNIFTERELSEDSVVKEYLTTASDAKNYKTLYYNLNAIIAVDTALNRIAAHNFASGKPNG